MIRESRGLTPAEQASYQALAHAATPWANYNATRLNRLIDQGKLRIFLAERGTGVVGVATLGGLHLPRRMLRVVVDPDHQRAGVGSALLERMLSLVPDGVPVGGAVSLHHVAGMSFAARHGFVVSREEDPSDHLELALPPGHPRLAVTADPRVSRLRQHRAAWGDAFLNPLLEQAMVELPDADSLDRWLVDPCFFDGLDQELSAVAMDDGRPAGFTLVRREANVVHVLLTLVLADFRGRGIARAMKTHTVAALGRTQWLATECVRGNAPIMALNRSLGFVDVSTRFGVRQP